MEYVVLERLAGQVEHADVRRKMEAAGAVVLLWRGYIGVVKFEGEASVLVERAGGLTGWLVSENRGYRLSGATR